MKRRGLKTKTIVLILCGAFVFAAAIFMYAQETQSSTHVPQDQHAENAGAWYSAELPAWFSGLGMEAAGDAGVLPYMHANVWEWYWGRGGNAYSANAVAGWELTGRPAASPLRGESWLSAAAWALTGQPVTSPLRGENWLSRLEGARAAPGYNSASWYNTGFRVARP